MSTTEKFPATVTFLGERLIEHKRTLGSDISLINNLREEADKKLSMPLLSVVYRKIKPASGNPHDYSSRGPYWWPNPNTESGFPYIRRDGEVNPDVNDGNSFGKLFDSVELFTLAALYLGDEKYSRKACELIECWYINPETKMNPHLEYGQAIPGMCDGRGIGLIDCASSYKLFNSAAVLSYLGAISEQSLNSLKEWYDTFLNWMLTSEIGIDEERQHNNHGVWYDVQVAATAIFLGRKVLAQRTLALSFERRILKHIADDGSQPHELARTKAMSYSMMNLNGLMLLADMAKVSGCKTDLWNYKKNDVPLLKRALDYLCVYFDDFSKFPFEQIDGKFSRSSQGILLKMGESAYPGHGYLEKMNEIIDDKMFWRLIP